MTDTQQPDPFGIRIGPDGPVVTGESATTPDPHSAEAALQTVRTLRCIILNGDQGRWITRDTAQAWLNELRVVEHHLQRRAEVEAERDRALQHVDELQDKLLSMQDNGKCCCSFDAPGDVCMPHSPTVNRLTAERDEARQVARRAYRNWMTPRQRDLVDENPEFAHKTARVLGVDALPGWLTDDSEGGRT